GSAAPLNSTYLASPTGFVEDHSVDLRQPFPNLPTPLPNTAPASENYISQVLTTAKDANRPGYVQNYNLTLQYQLPGQVVLETAFIGNKGTRLWGAFGIFSEYDGLPSSRSSMEASLTEPFSTHHG